MITKELEIKLRASGLYCSQCGGPCLRRPTHKQVPSHSLLDRALAAKRSVANLDDLRTFRAEKDELRRKIERLVGRK
jgi:hypothetical protein